MLEILKNMFRRKMRTLLTVFGITIGILALVVMGSIAEKLNVLVDGGVRYYKDKVTVSTEGGNFVLSPMQLSKKSEIEKVEGVKAVFGETYSTLEKSLDSVSFGPPASIVSQENGGSELESFELYISKGRELKDDDSYKVVLGSDLVKKLDAEVGKNVKLRDQDYEVVGIYEKTFSTPDTAAFIPFKNGQELMLADQPEVIRNNIKAADLVYDFVVYPKEGVNPDELAKKIKAEVKGVTAIGPKAFQDQIASTVKIFTSIIYGIGAISLLVGSLSIINTMTMSISERTKEIGLKKAVGAKPRSIMAEYLTEAGIIGLMGGSLGVGLGYLITNTINAALEKSGDKVFLLSPRLAIGSLIFSLVLGVVAGIYPAYYAVKINIVKALREE
jgi:putative ABC transport system permease protein